MTTTPTSFTTDEDVNMVKKFYIVSCAALVACLCLFAQDAEAGGTHKFGRSFLEVSGVQKAQRATINRRQRAGIGKLKGSTQGPAGISILLPALATGSSWTP